MQKILLFTFLSLLFATLAFANKSSIDEVVNALKAGNATELARFVDDKVEVSLPDKSGSYNKGGAQAVLSAFFAKAGVNAFEVKHKGDSNGSQFCIGTLQTNSGSYRTTVFMKVSNGKQVLKEIRFQAV